MKERGTSLRGSEASGELECVKPVLDQLGVWGETDKGNVSTASVLSAAIITAG